MIILTESQIRGVNLFCCLSCASNASRESRQERWDFPPSLPIEDVAHLLIPVAVKEPLCLFFAEACNRDLELKEIVHSLEAGFWVALWTPVLLKIGYPKRGTGGLRLLVLLCP